jgi:nitrogen regulatory protein PII-like uncharacterized protein
MAELDQVKRFGRTMNVRSAIGVTGFILVSLGKVYFRVYDQNHKFVDYELAHTDLEVTIHADCDAAFYEHEHMNILDHTTETLGLKP